MSKTAQKNGFDPTQPAETDLAAPTAVTDEAAPVESPIEAPALVPEDEPIPPLSRSAVFCGPQHVPDTPGAARDRGDWRNRTSVCRLCTIQRRPRIAERQYRADGDNPQDARTATGTIAPYAPAQPTNQAAAVKPAIPSNAAKAAPAILATPIAPPLPPEPVKPAAPQFRDAAQALQAARLAFRANDLSAAQAALGAAQTLQPGNADAQSLLTELKPLAARRDAALQAAQLCASQQSWSCARQHANEALAIDTGNDTAKTILATRDSRDRLGAAQAACGDRQSSRAENQFGYRIYWPSARPICPD